MTGAVLALGITQITAWGTSYYCLGVLAGPISQDTGWSRGFVFLGFTVALLAMGLVSSTVGRAIDRHGGRAVMTLGTILVSAGLFALAHVRSEPAYLAVWAFLGLGMRLCLYDAAFAALVQVAPSRGRTAISYLTLFGAFASSVFWVVGHALNDQVGWRQTLVLFALINLVVCLPLHWLGLARREAGGVVAAPAGGSKTSPDGPPLEGRVRSVAIGLFALIMSLNGFVFGVVSVQLVPMLEAAGLATAAAVWVASTKGVAQFGGRVVEIVFARNLRAITVGRIAVGILPPSLLLLLFGTGQSGDGRRLHAAHGRLPGRDHDRPRRGAARAVRHEGVRRGARRHRHPGAHRQCRRAHRFRLDRGPLGLGDRRARCSWWAAPPRGSPWS